MVHRCLIYHIQRQLPFAYHTEFEDTTGTRRNSRYQMYRIGDAHFGRGFSGILTILILREDYLGVVRRLTALYTDVGREWDQNFFSQLSYPRINQVRLEYAGLSSTAMTTCTIVRIMTIIYLYMPITSIISRISMVPGAGSINIKTGRHHYHMDLDGRTSLPMLETSTMFIGWTVKTSLSAFYYHQDGMQAFRTLHQHHRPYKWQGKTIEPSWNTSFQYSSGGWMFEPL